MVIAMQYLAAMAAAGIERIEFKVPGKTDEANEAINYVDELLEDPRMRGKTIYQILEQIIIDNGDDWIA